MQVRHALTAVERHHQRLERGALALLHLQQRPVEVLGALLQGLFEQALK